MTTATPTRSTRRTCLVAALSISLLAGSALLPASAAAPAKTPVSKGKFIEVGAQPEGIAFAARKMWVANSVDGSVSVIDARTEKVVATVGDLPQAEDVVAAPDGTSIYVSYLGSQAGNVAEIDTRTSKVVRTLPGDGGTLAIGPRGKVLYQSPGGGAVNRTDLATGKTRKLPGTKDTVVYTTSPGGKYLFGSLVDFVQSQPQPKLVKINARSGRTKTSVDLVENTNWSFAGDMIFDPRGRFLYVSKLGINNGFSGINGTTVQRYHPADLRAGKAYSCGQGNDLNVELGPTGLAFPKKRWQTRLACVNSNGGVAVINLRSGQTTMRTKTGTYEKSPTQGAFLPNGRRLYVTNTGFGVSNPPTTVTLFRVG